MQKSENHLLQFSAFQETCAVLFFWLEDFSQSFFKADYSSFRGK